MSFPERCRYLVRTYRFELALFVICAAVFIPRVIVEDRERQPRGIWFGDIPYYIHTVESMLTDGDLDLKNQLGGDPNRLRDSIGLGTDGEWYSTHSILMPLAACPFFILLGPDVSTFLAFNVLVCIAIVLLIFRLCAIYAPPWAAFATAVIFAFTSQIMVTLYNFSPDAFATVVTLIGMLYLLKDRPLLAGVFWGLSILSRTTNVVPYAAVFPYLLIHRHRIPYLLKFLAGSVPFIVIFMLLNWAQYGSPFTVSYSNVLMLTENGLVVQDNKGLFGMEFLASGLWGQLVDMDHGLLFTNMAALIGLFGLPILFRMEWRKTLLILSVSLSLYIFHALFKLWYISHSGCNRYLFTAVALMAVPFACLLVRLLDRKLASSS